MALQSLAPKAKPTNTTNTETFDPGFNSRVSKELVIGLSGPTGCGISNVVSQAKASLESQGYKVVVIKLSKFIDTAFSSKKIEKPNRDNSRGSRYLNMQDGGNLLRKSLSNTILAEYAIREIVLSRKDNPAAPENYKEFVPTKTAYLIDQLKHPDEVELLRKVYRNLFLQIGVVSIYKNRLLRLEKDERIPSDIANKIMERDRQEEDENGQKLDKTLKMSDYFLSTDTRNNKSLQKNIERFFNLLHGHDNITPTKQEYGMYVAFAAGLRSACMSRQVGAAIAADNGEIMSTGCNDVPKGGGGLYSFEDQDSDKRCVHSEGKTCFNDREKNHLKDELKAALKVAKKSDDSLLISNDADLDSTLKSVFNASRIKDLIEFSRAVHAEMDALLSLVRTGSEGVKGATLYTTTFPCHSCARHIVAAGIHKTYYIEPYEKSLAQSLHSDSITFDSDDTNIENKTHFIHFEGVAPSKYLHFFSMSKRKDNSGIKIEIPLTEAKKTVNEFLDDYRDFEAKVVQHLEGTMQ